MSFVANTKIALDALRKAQHGLSSASVGRAIVKEDLRTEILQDVARPVLAALEANGMARHDGNKWRAT